MSGQQVLEHYQIEKVAAWAADVRAWAERATSATEAARYRQALEAIVASDMHKGHICETCAIARMALGVDEIAELGDARG